MDVDERAAGSEFEEFALAELGGLLRYAVMESIGRTQRSGEPNDIGVHRRYNAVSSASTSVI
jgi:hypothetical protein